MTDKRCTQTHTQHNNSPTQITQHHPTHLTHYTHHVSQCYLIHLCCSSKHTPHAHTHTPCTSHLGMYIHTQMHSQHPHPRPVTYTQHPVSHPLEPEELQPPTPTSLLYEEHSQTLPEKGRRGREQARACLCSFLRMWVSSPPMGVGMWGTGKGHRVSLVYSR